MYLLGWYLQGNPVLQLKRLNSLEEATRYKQLILQKEGVEFVKLYVELE